MVRSYRIHTDLDGSDNTVFDMNDGEIRFYQPSDLGITTTTNIWKSDGIGIFGNSQVNHPQLDFKLETFGDTLEENYQIFNEFINAILAQKFVTLEYTTSLGTFYADVKLAKVTKTEAYGFNGTFSEKIAFDTITAWYTYQQLKFSKFENGKFNENTKIHAHAEWQKFNLLDGTKDFSGDWAQLSGWITDGTYKGLTVKKRTGKGSGFYKFFTVPIDGTYTFSSYLKSSGNGGTIRRWVNINGTDGVGTIDFTSNFDWMIDNFSISLKAGDIAFVRYEITSDGTGLDIWNAGHKWEENEVATPWLPSKNEAFDVVGRYTYSDTSYIYSTEENIDRFSKWLIEDNIFSFVARLTPSKNVVNKKYGLRFLNYDANEYSAIVFNLPNEADVIQINTDSNDEYYQAIFNGQAVNMFSALDFQRFRTRLFEKGSMELIGLDSVEMNVKRKVDFV